jgi:hypothetical protein
VVTEIRRIHKEGRPVLVGTTSVEKSELLSEMLAAEGIKHQVRARVCVCVCGLVCVDWCVRHCRHACCHMPALSGVRAATCTR